MSAAIRGPRRRRTLRAFIGIAVTIATLALALRDVDFPTLVRDMARANLPMLIVLSVPLHVAMLWVRALRWRYLTDAVRPIDRPALFRATSVGALANNVFPLRIGEVVRAYYLARETAAGTAALFGTIVLERGIDGLCVLALAVAIFGARGSADAGVLAVGVPLIAAGLLPLGAMVWLRFRPDQVIGLMRGVLGVVTRGRGAASAEVAVRRVADGLGSLQGGTHLWWVAWHSVVIWTFLGIAPFVVAIWSLGIPMGGLDREIAAGFVTLAAVGVAVALPSAPGFLGPYHLAAREALRRFGVSEELALAVGTLSHAVFWITTTAVGLLVLRFRGARLDELAAAASDEHQVPFDDRR
jgi:uncharacterized protein (TIRG00374 family)